MVGGLRGLRLALLSKHQTFVSLLRVERRAEKVGGQGCNLRVVEQLRALSWLLAPPPAFPPVFLGGRRALGPQARYLGLNIKLDGFLARCGVGQSIAGRNTEVCFLPRSDGPTCQPSCLFLLSDSCGVSTV